MNNSTFKNIEIYKLLVENKGDVNKVDFSVSNWLHLATHLEGFNEEILEIMAKGMKKSQKNGFNGYNNTPLTNYVCSNKDASIQMIEKMKKIGFSLNICSTGGKNVLHRFLAKREKFNDLLLYLLDDSNCIDINKIDDFSSRTPLDHSIISRNPDNFYCILAHGANLKFSKNVKIKLKKIFFYSFFFLKKNINNSYFFFKESQKLGTNTKN